MNDPQPTRERFRRVAASELPEGVAAPVVFAASAAAEANALAGVPDKHAKGGILRRLLGSASTVTAARLQELLA